MLHGRLWGQHVFDRFLNSLDRKIEENDAATEAAIQAQRSSSVVSMPEPTKRTQSENPRTLKNSLY